MKKSCVLIALLLAGSVAASAQGFSDKDKLFLKKSAQGDVAAVKMAELVISKTANPKVKMLAEKMRADHTGLYLGSKPVARLAGMEQPDTSTMEGNMAYVKLNVLRGRSFDRSYVKTLRKEHAEDMKLVQDEAATTGNQHIKVLAGHESSVLAAHESMIQDAATSLGLK